MMMGSREAVVDYMMPLGLHHLMDTGHHYGPGPWVDNLNRADWNPTYYHRADANGIGFDRGPKGSNAVAQYGPKVAAHVCRPAQGAGTVPALVPSRAVGLQDLIGPHPVGRAGVPLHAWRRSS